MNVVAIGDPFCGWVRAVFCYIWGSGTLQFPHIFDKIQVRACSNFNHFGTLSPFSDSVFFVYRACLNFDISAYAKSKHNSKKKLNDPIMAYLQVT